MLVEVDDDDANVCCDVDDADDDVGGSVDDKFKCGLACTTTPIVLDVSVMAATNNIVDDDDELE
jgi:hypothetical protein